MHGYLKEYFTDFRIVFFSSDCICIWVIYELNYMTALCANTYFARISCYFLIWTELLLKNRIKMAFVINVSIKFNDLFALVVYAKHLTLLYIAIWALGWNVRWEISSIYICCSLIWVFWVYKSQTKFFCLDFSAERSKNLINLNRNDRNCQICESNNSFLDRPRIINFSNPLKPSDSSASFLWHSLQHTN